MSQEDGEFVWSKKIQGHVLGSFFWGYMVTQIPGGYLAARFGGKHVFGWFMLLCAVSTLFMPLAARVSYIFLIVLRILAGIGQVRKTDDITMYTTHTVRTIKVTSI